MKLGLIGIGHVGSQILTDIQYENLFSEITVIDSNENLAYGEALDHVHMQGLESVNHIDIHRGDYADLHDADVIAISASAPMDPNMPDRVALTKDNASLVTDIMQRIAQVTQSALVIFITNPVDAMTYLAQDHVDYPKEKIMGTGTLLESARFRTLIAQHYQIDPKSVNAFVIGEHGKNAVPVWSKVTIFGMPIAEYEKLANVEPIDQQAITDQVDKVAFDVLKNKGWTSSTVSRATTSLIRHLLLNERSILPITAPLNGEYDLDHCAMSLPTLVDKNGIVERYAIELNEDETRRVKDAADYIQSAIQLAQENL
ncbi:lactate/malate family dehydrogenase [Staphylococcus argensis]|uniref:Lactate dehydrogenase n=1 Tax=Staphylococcus argensis TaxID=1607738 RepID=A0A2K4FD03_9STAP|nr:lactate dehydrogenase [Staphylococcus argensis]MCY6990922.1 lactate dehydrogenase [Staphylococcus argensis]POA09232.1 lactate dehydrogenase [Staphylococcus argensis]